MGKLYAISDVHISYKFNHDAIHLLQPHPEDSLIIAGDVGEKLEHLRTAFSLTTTLFKQVFWVPGNHELYTMPESSISSISNIQTADTTAQDTLRGEMKYLECVRIANECGVITPEDEYIVWHGDDMKALICPLFCLYDYSFRPSDVSREDAVEWAKEEGVYATDEALLHPDPYESRDAWCDELVRKTEIKLETAMRMKDEDTKVVLINHWPLREDLCWLPNIPRFSIWCGTKKTDNWHRRFQADVVVSGHLHIRRTDWRDETRFEEVSLGYPKQWEGARERGKGVEQMMREILPEGGEAGKVTTYRKYG